MTWPTDKEVIEQLEQWYDSLPWYKRVWYFITGKQPTIALTIDGPLIDTNNEEQMEALSKMIREMNDDTDRV